MKVVFFLALATLTSALNEHVINKRVLPINYKCDPNSGICRKGDWINSKIADCSKPHSERCNAVNDVWYSWIVDVESKDQCKPVKGKRFECGGPGTNTRCVCSDTKLPFNNECKCQYWPPKDVGANSPAFCTGYYTGGTSGWHHYACCNNCQDPTPNNCDGTTWHGGTNTNYCGTCGQNAGGGRVKYYYNCGSCDNQKACKSRCWYFNFPTGCWRWLDCFKGCCLDTATQPRNKRDVSELSFCGDGTCSDSETPDSCPGDCCYQINSVNCTSNISECEPACCHAPNCCLGDNNNKKSSSNEGAAVGIPIVVVATIAIVIVILAIIIYYKRKKQIPSVQPIRYENL